MNSSRISDKFKQLDKNQLYKSMFEDNCTIQLIIDPATGNIIDANTAAIKFYGYSYKDITNKTIFDIIIMSKDSVKETMYEVINKETNIFFFKHRLSTGEIRDVEVRSGLIEMDEVKLIYSIIHDITDRMRVKAALDQSEKRWMFALEGSNNGVWDWNIETNEVFYSNHWKNMLGYNEDEISNTIQEWESRVHPDDKEQIYSNLKKHLSGETSSYISEHRMLTKEGTYKWILDKGMVIERAEDGRPLRAIGTHSDINEAKQLQIELTKQKLFLKSLIDSIPDFIFYKNVNGEYLGCNNAFASKCVGIKEDEIIGKTVTDLVKDKELSELIINTDHEVVEERNTKTHDEIFNLVNGQTVDVEFAKTPFFDEYGNVSGIIGIGRDITKRKQSEMLYKAAKEQAEAANIAKSQFLANISHEIRTPLNGIMGFLELLSKTSLTKQQVTYLKEARRASGILLSLINDILDFSKIDAGKTELQSAKFNICSIVEEAVILYTPKAYKKNIEIQSFIHPDIPNELYGDPGRLKQVLNNLISNAVKFTEQGQITVTAKLKEKANDNVSILFEVSDTGIGIPKTHIDKIFEAFTQVDSSTTRKFGGTGLGLTISKQLVELMNGSIWMDSQPGKGTDFYFTSLFKYDQIAQSKKTTKNNVPQGLKVILVDSNITNKNVLKGYLEHESCSVSELDSITLLDKESLLSQSFSDIKILIIINYKMLINVGPEFEKLLKLRDSVNNVKILFTLPINRKVDIFHIKDKGFCDYITTPFKKKEIIHSIYKAFSGMTNSSAKNFSGIKSGNALINNSNKKPRILLAEDSDTNRRLMLNILNTVGLKCDIVENGKEAVEACINKNYDIVFMDCQMPIMDGYEASSKIRSIKEKGQNIVIIAITANALKGDREKCLSAGMNDYISKPVSIKKIIDLINKYGYESSKELYKEKLKSNSNLMTIINSLVRETGINDRQAKELIKEYLNVLPGQISELNERIEAADYAGAKNLLHKMKGTSGNLRISYLSELLAVLEKELHGIKKDSLDSIIHKMNDYTELLKYNIE